MKKTRNYYAELNKKITDFEYGKYHSTLQLSRIADKIAWCFKWKKITTAECDELCDRVTILFKSKTLTLY